MRGFRPHRQWAVDVDYLRRLPEAEREWMRRFLSEYYDADNKLLRPDKHLAACPQCSRGGTCGRRPPPSALHDSDELRRECYRRQKAAYEDVYSRGRVSLWEDYDGVDTEGVVTTSHGARKGAALAPRKDAGDYADSGEAPAVVSTLQIGRKK